MYASPGQLNLQLPFSIGTGYVSFTVITGGVLGNSVDIELKPAAPGLFLAAHLGGTPVSEQNPAVPGETLVIYSTGLGPVGMDIPDGEPTPSSPQVSTMDPVLTMIGGESADVQSSYLTPGLIGVYEVHATVPQSAGTGKTSLVVNSCGIDSPPLWIDISTSN